MKKGREEEQNMLCAAPYPVHDLQLKRGWQTKDL